MATVRIHLKAYAALAIILIVLIIGTFVITGSLWPSVTPSASPSKWGSVGICVHSLSENDARLANASGAGWVRIDASENLSDFGVAVRNAKAYNLSVLAILDSWMFNQSTVFTLEQWRGSTAYYLSNYADYVDAWEIWNEPTNRQYPLLNLSLTNEESQQNMTAIVNFYYAMAQTAYPIIRQNDPTAKILLFGGLHLYAEGNQPDQVKLDKDFADRLAATNISAYGDGISVHAYSWGKSLGSVSQTYSASLAYYRALFNDSFEVWVTETGMPIQPISADEAVQAHYMIDALHYFQTNTTKVF